jgi:pimeloyl-ACP methyl ester carboxylesterase
MLAAVLSLLVACQPSGQLPVRDARSATGLAYDLVGEGSLVVLIHGSNLDRRMWEAEVAWLQEHTRVLWYDLRGQGASDDPAEAYSNHADLLALLDELGEREVSLIGLSGGAQVALDVALEAPQLVQRMVLVSPSLIGYVPDKMPSFFAGLRAALQVGDFERANEVLLDSPIMSVPPRFAGLVRTMVEDNSRLWTIPYSLVEQVSPPAIERLETIRTPTLILVGANDLEAIRAQSQLLERRLGDARRVTITGGGHLLNLTSPDAFRQAVSAFLSLPGD